MSRISFFKHSKALKDAYQDVLNNNTDTNWSIFTYDGKENELKVAGTGDGGLEELEDEFSGSKIMYAFARVKDPKTSLDKFLLINWQGEGAPAARKGQCANHVADVARFFQGAHITLTCRNDDEITEEEILKQVSKASASTYSFSNKPSMTDEPAGPVGSVYKRINPQAEISSTNKETFWERQEREEMERKKSEQARVTEDRKKHLQELKEQDKLSNNRRKEWEKTRDQEITQKKIAMKQADDQSEIRRKEKAAWEAEQQAMEREQQRGRKRSESVEKAAEAASLVGNRDVNPKSLWEQRINEANREPERPPPKSYTAPPSQSYDAPTSYNEPANTYQEEPQQQYDQQGADDVYEEAGYDAQQQSYDTPQQSYGAPQDDVYEEPPSTQTYDDNHQNQQEAYNGGQDNYGGDNAYQGEYDTAYGDQPAAPSTGQEQGRTAKTMFDYQAADDTEISFDVDELITEINMIDEGWWEGRASDGSFGLFPANYVELQ